MYAPLFFSGDQTHANPFIRALQTDVSEAKERRSKRVDFVSDIGVNH
jgi:hypothetical protein